MNLEFDPNSLNIETPEIEENVDSTPTPSSATKNRARVKMLTIGFGFFFFFLLFKLPEKQIQKFIIAHIKINAQKTGFTFNAEKVKIGLIFGPVLKMYNVEMASLNDDKVKLKIPYFKISPHLFSLLPLFKMKKISIVLEIGSGDVDGTVGVSSTGYYLNLDFDQFPIDTLAMLALPNGMSLGSASNLTGKVKLLMDDSNTKNNEGDIRIKLNSIAIPSQSIMGMALPKVSVRESKAELDITEGKIAVKSLALGQDIKKDDLVANITGDGTIGAPRPGGSPLDRINVNLKADFQLSSGITAAIPLLDSILGGAKGSDGKYHYNLKGPLSSPLPTPAK